MSGKVVYKTPVEFVVIIIIMIIATIGIINARASTTLIYVLHIFLILLFLLMYIIVYKKIPNQKDIILFFATPVVTLGIIPLSTYLFDAQVLTAYWYFSIIVTGVVNLIVFLNTKLN